MAGSIIKDESPPVRRWVVPSMEKAPEQPDAIPAPPRPEETSPAPLRDIEREIAAAREEGYREGRRAQSEEAFRKGYQQGIDEGLQQAAQRARQNDSLIEIERQQLQSRATHLEQLLHALADPLSQLDKEVEEQLVELVLAVARQLIRRELKADPGQIIAVVREAVALLPVAARDYRLALHPEDAALVRDALAMDDNGGSRPWTIVEDPTLTRGGCRVVSEASYIDATVERRLAAVAAALLGDEREAAR